MRNRELFWGFFFLFSAVFILYVSLWKFITYLEISYIILLVIFEYISLIYSIIITTVAIVAMVRSFYYFRTDLTEEKTIKWYTKIIIIGSDFFYLYLIFLIIEVLIRW